MSRSAKSKRQEKLERSFAEAGCDMSIAEDRESSPAQGLSHRFRLPDTDTPHVRPLPKPVLLPETFGNQPGQDFTTYIRHFVHTCKLSGYDDDQKLRLLPARLVRTAHAMFTEILTHTPDINFSDTVEALLTTPPSLANWEWWIKNPVQLSSKRSPLKVFTATDKNSYGEIIEKK